MSNYPKDPHRQLQGLRNRMAGGTFERYLSVSCKYYEMHGEALIEKTPEPMKVLKSLPGGQFIACFLKKAQPDYKGTLRGGRAIVFEAKHTADGNIGKDALTDEQGEKLEKHYLLGADCYVMVSIGFKAFYCVPWIIWRDMKIVYGRQYMKPEELEKFRVPFRNGMVLFLDEGERLK